MPGPSKKYVPKVEINAAPRMINSEEQFDDNLAEPTEDFRADFNPSYGDDNNYEDTNFANNRIQTPVPSEAVKPYSPVIPQVPQEPVFEAPMQPEIPAPQAAFDNEFNLQLHEHEDAISKNIEDQKELTNSLRELFDKINSQGVDALAKQLTDTGNFEVAEKVESFAEAEADPNIDFQENLNIQDIQDVQSEVQELIAENPEFEAEPALGFEQPADTGFGEPAEAAFGEPAQNEFGLDAGFNEAAEPGLETGLGEPSFGEGETNSFGENAYGENPAVEADGELGNEFPEISEAEGDAEVNSYDDEGETDSDSESDLSKNSERPTGESQDLQSQWAQPSEGILSNQDSADSFIPQMSRDFNDNAIDQGILGAVDPLHPIHNDIVNAGSDSTDGRLDVHEDNEPYNDYGNYGNNQYNRYRYNKQIFTRINPFQRIQQL